MNPQEILKDLTRKKTSSVCCICFHETHPAVCELIAEDEMEKYMEAEGGYEILAKAPGKAEALAMVQDALLFAFEKDASLKSVKRNIRQYFETL